MLSDKPLPDMTFAEALDVLAQLYKTYVDPKVNEGLIRAEIERLDEDVDIESVLVDIGKALHLAEQGTGFSMARASQQSLLARIGMEELEKRDMHFSDAKGVDTYINNTQRFQSAAENLANQALIEKARLDADIKAYRRACNIPAYKEISQSLQDGLFGRTGVQVPRIKLEKIQPQPDQENARSSHPGMEL
jgi:hypothetical protein